MLCKVAFIGVEQVSQHRVDLRHITRLSPSHNGFRHASNGKETAEVLTQLVGKEIGQGVEAFKACHVRVEVSRPHGTQVLRERHWIHVEKVNLAHGESAGITRKANSKQ